MLFRHHIEIVAHPPNLAAAYPERAAAPHLVGKENVDVVEKAAGLHLFGKQNADVPAEYP